MLTVALIGGSDLALWWLVILVAALACFYGPIWGKEFYDEWVATRARRDAAKNTTQSLNQPILSTAYTATRRANKKALVKMRLKQATPMCPLCREEVLDERKCHSCSTEVHQECAAELSGGKCPTIGCGRSLGETSIRGVPTRG